MEKSLFAGKEYKVSPNVNGESWVFFNDSPLDQDKKINLEFKKIIEEIKENSNIQITTKDKNEQDIIDLLNELILDFREQNNLKKIESLEKKLINNLDENSYSELIKLKSQLNRD